MRLLPDETERLQLFLAAELARRRRSRGLRLNHPEAAALIADELCEAARDGIGYDEVVDLGYRLLSEDDVLPGVPELLGRLQVEPLFEEGSLLVTLYQPVRTSGQHESPLGGVEPAAPTVVINADRTAIPLQVVNRLTRAVQVTSHYHFFEANRGLSFDRERAYGRRLDVAAGTSVRFEPGEARTVHLVELGGNRVVRGCAGLVDGPLDDAAVRERAFQRAAERGYLDGGRPVSGAPR